MTRLNIGVIQNIVQMEERTVWVGKVTGSSPVILTESYIKNKALCTLSFLDMYPVGFEARLPRKGFHYHGGGN